MCNGRPSTEGVRDCAAQQSKHQRRRKGTKVIKRAAVMLSIVAAVAFMGRVTAQEQNILATFKGAIGVIPVSNVSGPVNADGTFPSVTRNVVRGISPAGGPWTIADLKATVTTDGGINVKGRELLLASGNRIGQNGSQRVFATLICEAGTPFTERSTAVTGVTLQPNGDFRIDDTLNPAPPPECASPLLLIRSTGNGTWFAAAISRLDDVHLDIGRLMGEGL